MNFTSLRTATIVSDGLGYGLCPPPDKEVKQKLTISQTGWVWLSAYTYGDGYPYHHVGTNQRNVGKDLAGKLLAAIGDCFSRYEVEELATDIGTWELHLKDMDGSDSEFFGSLCSRFDYRCEDLSALIRRELGNETLILFDGNLGSDWEDEEDG